MSQTTTYPQFKHKIFSTSQHGHVFVCVSVYLSVCVFSYLCVCLSACHCICEYACLCVSVYLFSVFLYIISSVFLVCLCIWIAVNMCVAQTWKLWWILGTGFPVEFWLGNRFLVMIPVLVTNYIVIGQKPTP